MRWTRRSAATWPMSYARRRPSRRSPIHPAPSSVSSAAHPGGSSLIPHHRWLSYGGNLSGLLPGAALDGKACRGARTEQGGRVFLVGAISHEHGVILGQCQVAGKRGEGPAARTLLPRLEVAGTVLTLDALHTAKATARLITEQLDAHYVLILKGNHCATRRSFVSPMKSGRTRRNVLESDGLPQLERVRGTRACQEISEVISATFTSGSHVRNG
ncbi:ISAs1 family transposase [Streptosporangium sp. NBC_01755]|uniref:ISAs1 family transposase n=1 Tax=Streptosporangium sp. NBC_01755 TaxID=2975949 RepID=UPI003FA36D8B